MRLSTVQRRLLTRTFILGALLTTAVVYCDYAGMLEAFERWIYDRRASRFQFTSPPPTKDLVHIHLDDQTITDVGRWPWPRWRLARIIRELHLAGAKVIALDIMLTEPEAAHDAELAAAISEANCVLVPAAAGKFAELTEDPIEAAMVRYLLADPELESPEVSKRLVSDGFDPKTVEATVRDSFLTAQERAVITRIDRALDGGNLSLDEVLAQVVPKSVAAAQNTDAQLRATTCYPRVLQMRRMDRFMRPVPVAAPPLLRTNSHTLLTPVPALIDAARYSGYVDFVPEDDAVVRRIPLASVFRGRLLPHMALSTACAALDVPTDKIEYRGDRIILPVPDAAPVEIPTHTIDKGSRYGPIGLFMDLPWFGAGGDKWYSMYDFPEFHRPQQQESVLTIWKIEQLRESIGRNDEQSLDAILYFRGSNTNSTTEADRLRSAWPNMTRAQRDGEIESVLNGPDGIKENYQALKEQTPEELAAILKEQPSLAAYIPSYNALLNAKRSNEYLQARIDESRVDLKSKLQGKVIMIGASALGLYDYYPTSLYPQCPGVVIQGVAVNAMLTREFWRHVPWWIGPLTTASMGALVTLFVAFFPSYRALLATVFLAGTYLLLNGYFLFDYSNLLVPAAGAMTASGLVWGILTLYRYIFESGERTRITKRFSSYVDPAIVNFVIEDPDRVQFDGEVREMTVVFTDLAGFTTISEKLQERTVPLLNDYMSRMMPIIRKYKGTWNKFLGDGIMFFYNAPRDDPDHARDAICTVLEMQKSVEEFNKDLFKQQLPKVAMRAGIVTGNMIAGDAGSITAADPQHAASDYTVLGDNVNLSARLESANKALGSRTLCVERTIELMGEGILARPIAKLQVVGKTQGVMTYEPLAFMEEATDEQKALAEVTRKVVDSFVERRFEDAIAAAKEMQDRFGSSKFTALYLDHAREFLIAPPPEDWDGTIVLESK